MAFVINEGEDIQAAAKRAAEQYIRPNDPNRTNTGDLDPVKMQWRDEALEGLNKIAIEIGQKSHGTMVPEKTKEIGQAILKHIPRLELLTLLDYTEVKEVLAYVSSAWFLNRHDDFVRLKEKKREIEVRQSVTLNKGGIEYGLT